MFYYLLGVVPRRQGIQGNYLFPRGCGVDNYFLCARVLSVPIRIRTVKMCRAAFSSGSIAMNEEPTPNRTKDKS